MDKSVICPTARASAKATDGITMMLPSGSVPSVPCANASVSTCTEFDIVNIDVHEWSTQFSAIEPLNGGGNALNDALIVRESDAC